MVIFPSSAMLKKIGLLVKERRQDLHMSQVELAKGICTQTTISTLENNGCFSKWELIPEIIKRLDIDVKEIENKSLYRYGERNLRQVELCLLTHKFSKALKLLSKIKKENLDSKDLLARFYCDLGFSQLFMDGSLDDVTTSFTTAIYKHTSKNNQMVISWSFLGMAIAYQRLRLQKRSLEYYKLAISKLNISLRNIHKKEDLWVNTQLALAVVVFGFEISEHPLVQKECDLVMNILRCNYSYYCLKDFYYVKGISLKAENKEEAAEKLFMQSNGLCCLRSSNNVQKLLKINQYDVVKQ